MFYLKKAFGINSQKTIEAIDKNLEFLMGNRAGLSFYDAKTANLAYKCYGKFKMFLNSEINRILFVFFYKEKCTNPSVCQNDGFLNSKCVCECPPSTSGKYCESFIAKSKKMCLKFFLSN